MVKGIKILLVILGIFLAFGYWYKKKFSMKEAVAYELNSADELNKIYIATQGSVFKDQLVEQLGNHFADKNSYVRITDVKNLPNITVNDWDAVIILHTWEMQKPPGPVKTFVSENSGSSKLVVFCTSGSGEDGMENIDGLTGASVLSEINDDMNEIIERVEPLLIIE